MIAILGRINELSRKQHAGGLTEQEKKEQAELRTEYLQQIRGQVHDMLLGVSVVDDNGYDVTPKKLAADKAILLRDER
ncbi:DUF896 domain-containing protein [Paenibacillus sp. JDR-2]|uniref:DUF896 domain-containing protein n=1 Tax=Paenibacillus sp. (strain JDR-2) TaxID=324057 RepID=UPI000166475A|nr:DUF896 domain-containing protein [Paenibacillus sp. JDR-2]ACT03892.1 protein of unknown function DUF896 [Paenibacillus sp. JDR-2]